MMNPLSPSLFTILKSAILWMAVALPSVSMAAPADECPLPKNWRPQLDPETLEPILKESFRSPSGIIPQQALNQYLSIMAGQWDAELMETYLDLSRRLDSNGKRILLSEQTAWLTKREKEATRAGKSEEGGTLGPASYSETFITLTKARERDLQKRLSEVK